ncbi:MAG: energy-coupling factor transporter transmembrane component T [Bacilli bacterium]
MVYFRKLHPIVSLVFLLSLLFLTMLTSNPLFLTISFVSSLITNALFQKAQLFWKNMLIILIIILVITVTNPLFNQNGETILFNIGNISFTMESFLKGLFIGIMLGAIILWFNVFNEIMTTEKMYYLFGKIVPTISLILSMGFRFIPLMRKQMQKIEEGQKGMGLYAQTTFIKKIKHYLRMFSMLVTWSLENALETADTMKSRGYGLKPRTSFTNFTFRFVDGLSLVYILLLFMTVSTKEFLNVYDFSFFPTFSNLTFTLKEITGYLAFSLLGLFLIIMAGKEAIVWRYWMLKI